MTEDEKYSILYQNGYKPGPVKRLYKWAMECEVDFDNKSIADFGCGNAVLPRMCSPALYTGIDIASYKINQLRAEELNDENDFIHSSIKDVVLPMKFDVGFCCDVLEHLQTEDEVEASIGNMLKYCKVLVSCVSIIPSFNLGPDGSNLHPTVKNANWWTGVFGLYGEISHYVCWPGGLGFIVYPK